MKRTVLVVTLWALANAAGASAQPSPDPKGTPKPPSSQAQTSQNELIGRDVFSKDQTLIGQVDKVVTSAEGEGRLTAIMIKTGGFLGFGTRVVSIPEGKFHMRGRNVQLHLTGDEVHKLPEQRNNS